MHNFFKIILKEKKKEISEAKKKISLEKLLRDIEKVKNSHIFKKAISAPHKLNLIAEIKKASPSRGIIRKNFESVSIAKIYESAGASAFSVLTEKKYFGGDISFIPKIKKVVHIPILRKDFIIDKYQIYESKFYQADAILLIARILSLNKLREFLKLAERLGLDCLVEVHTKEDLKKVLETDAQIIGINNRNLNNFKVDLKTSERIIKFIPKDKIIVVESGIKTKKDVESLRILGANAVLIGETFMRAKDIRKKISEIMG